MTTIADLRACPALAGPDDVAMLLAEFDKLRQLTEQFRTFMHHVHRYAVLPDADMGAVCDLLLTAVKTFGVEETS